MLGSIGKGLKSFGKSVLGSAGDAIAGAVGGVLGNQINPGESQAFSREDYGWQLGADRQSARKMDRFNWAQAEKRGLTAQEFYGSGAAGNTSTSSTSNVLGNSADQVQQQNRAQNQEIVQRAMDRNKDLQQTKMQTEAQVKTAEIAAGASRYGSDTQAAIAEGRLKLDRDTYQYVNLPRVAAQNGLTIAETRKKINEIATSDPKFVTMMKQLSMGADNLTVEFFLRHHGINLADPQSFSGLPADKRKELLGALLAIRSNVASEYAGATKIGHDFVDDLVSLGNSTLELGGGAVEGLGNLFGGYMPDRKTSVQRKNRRGSGARR